MQKWEWTKHAVTNPGRACLLRLTPASVQVPSCRVWGGTLSIHDEVRVLPWVRQKKDRRQSEILYPKAHRVPALSQRLRELGTRACGWRPLCPLTPPALSLPPRHS